jgi:copper(I)-binding protein
MTRIVALLALLTVAVPAVAVMVSVGNPWIPSAGVGGTSAAYMDLRSDVELKLVGASSPWADKIEIRAVETKDGAQVERVVGALDVPANTVVRLAPGGNYLALSAIRRGFTNGDYVPVTLRFEDAKQTPHTVDVNVQARGMTPPKRRAADSQ